MARGGRADRGGRGLARVAAVVRAGAAPLWWLGVLAAGIGVLVPGPTGRRIGVLAGAALFLVKVAVVARARRRRHQALARGASRAGRHDVLQGRAVGVRVWRRGHRWWLLSAFVAAPGGSFVLPAAGSMPPAAGRGGAVAEGRLARPAGTVRGRPVVGARRPARQARRTPAGRTVRAYHATGLAAGDAAPGGARRRTAALVQSPGAPDQTSRSSSILFSW